MFQVHLRLFYSWGRVRLSPLGTQATSGPTVPAPDVYDEGDDECGNSW
jgi:hypothetical protein